MTTSTKQTPPSNHITRDALRQAITTEMDAIMERYGHLETALRALEAADGIQRAPVAVPAVEQKHASRAPHKPSEMTKTDAILMVLQKNPDLSPQEVQAKMKEMGVDLPHGEVYTFLYRLKARGKVKAKGSAGSRRYYATVAAAS